MSLIQTLLLRAGITKTAPALLDPLLLRAGIVRQLGTVVSPRWRGPTPERVNNPKLRRQAREERRPRYSQLSNPERSAERKALRALGRRQWRLVNKSQNLVSKGAA